ncbi:hypothetical protein [Pararhodospirillum photometricum]|uniref:Uncharacterized protein n=1 Tax=Pararhodospirillum photometricum DSM 122 TaxID=1150469 RepID=H6SK99_PARPM|nr:hypothetical protein [Pararhodospirillum photometricum]CCG08414.1 Putative uncharacterized protein [Pararhodospirillum photometricum DSM 122]
MSFLDSLFGASPSPAPPPAPLDPFWKRNANLKYVPLMALASRPQPLRGRAGVFVLWIIGTRPAWVACGPSTDLEETVLRLADTPSIQEWERRGSLVFTWAPIVADKRDGVTAYLRTTLPFKGLSDTLDRALGIDPEKIRRASPVPVLPPG